MKKLWNKALETGHNTIDSHHKELFALISMLDQSIDLLSHAKVKELITFLQDYVLTHFHEEESLMEAQNFELINEHKNAHNKFRQLVKNLEHDFENETSISTLSFAIRKLIDALVIHIKTIDVKMVHLVKGSHEETTR